MCKTSPMFLQEHFGCAHSKYAAMKTREVFLQEHSWRLMISNACAWDE